MSRHSPYRRLSRLLPVLLSVALITACVPSGANYRIGISTNQISGRFDLTRYEPALGSPLVVAYKRHYQFVTLPSGERVTHPSAHVIAPAADGTYRLSMPSDVVGIDILFIAPDFVTREFRFRRQLGVGNISYDPKLKETGQWRDHYYTYLLPQLEHLIVEKRYRLAVSEQQILSDWLQSQQSRLANKQTGK